MRVLTHHKGNLCNNLLNVRVLDRPGHGNASHHYNISGPLGLVDTTLSFQDGPVNATGLNGLTHEVLLAILIDRLRGFQSGPYHCRENANALTHIEEALHVLNMRTKEREARGVEGTHVA